MKAAALFHVTRTGGGTVLTSSHTKWPRKSQTESTSPKSLRETPHIRTPLAAYTHRLTDATLPPSRRAPSTEHAEPAQRRERDVARRLFFRPRPQWRAVNAGPCSPSAGRGAGARSPAACGAELMKSVKLAEGSRRAGRIWSKQQQNDTAFWNTSLNFCLKQRCPGALAGKLI